MFDFTMSVYNLFAFIDGTLSCEGCGEMVLIGAFVKVKIGEVE